MVNEAVKAHFESLYGIPWEGYAFGRDVIGLDEVSAGEMSPLPNVKIGGPEDIVHVKPYDIVEHVEGMVNRIKIGTTVKGSELGNPAKPEKQYVLVGTRMGPSDLQGDHGEWKYREIRNNRFLLWRPVDDSDKYSGRGVSFG